MGDLGEHVSDMFQCYGNTIILKPRYLETSATSILVTVYVGDNLEQFFTFKKSQKHKTVTIIK